MDPSLEQYRDFYDLTPVMITSVDPLGGEVVNCNQQVLRSLGYSESEIRGKSVFELCVGDCADLARQAMLRLVNGDDLAEEELTIQCRDGTCMDVWLRAAAIRDADGAVRSASCVWQDISKRKTAQRALGETRRQMQAILQCANALIYVKDLQGRYVLINRRFEEMVDITLEQIRGKTDHEVFAADVAGVLRANDLTALDRDRPSTFEEIVTHNGTRRNYISVKFPLQDDRGQTYAIAGISTDISARMNAEAALKESDERFRQLAENVQDSFWIVDVQSWSFLYVNPAYETIWGRTRQELLMDSSIWLKSIHPADRLRVRRSFAHKITKGRYDEEYRVVRPDGSIRWVHDRGVPIHDRDGEVYRVVGIAQDITERKQLQRQVSEISAREQRRISQEIHDELGQQLTGLSFLAKSLERQLADEEVDAAKNAGSLANGIQDAIREVKRLVRGLAPVDLDEHGIRVALEQLATTTTERSNISCQFDCAFEVSIPDNVVATQLYRIAQEAINNATKYSQAEHIDVSLNANRGTVLLRIRDDGVGLPVDQNVEGGMGLQIMRYRAGIIGADLEVTSSRESGTEILCILRREPEGNDPCRD
jgi:PAS domain S-box-containing protein